MGSWCNDLTQSCWQTSPARSLCTQWKPRRCCIGPWDTTCNAWLACLSSCTSPLGNLCTHLGHFAADICPQGSLGTILFPVCCYRKCLRDNLCRMFAPERPDTVCSSNPHIAPQSLVSLSTNARRVGSSCYVIYLLAHYHRMSCTALRTHSTCTCGFGQLFASRLIRLAESRC